MRIAKIDGRDVPIRHNFKTRQIFKAQFGEELYPTVMSLLAPIKELVGGLDLGGIDLAAVDPAQLFVLAIPAILGGEKDPQEVLVKCLWACAKTADTSIADFDQWVSGFSDDAFAIISDSDEGEMQLADWCAQLLVLLEKNFFGVNLDSRLTSKKSPTEKDETTQS
jgi:hypothetical protein